MVLCSTGELAERFEVSGQTILNWAKRGLLEAAGRGTSEAGYQVYDLDAATAWKDANTGVGAGGKRKGAGRKPGLWRAAEAVPSVPTATADKTAGKEAEEFTGETVGNLDDLFRQAQAGTLPVSKVQMAKTLVEAYGKWVALKVEMGALIDARTWAADLTQFLTSVRTRLEAVPGRAAPIIATRLAITSPVDVLAVRTAIMDEIEAFIGEIRAYESANKEPKGTRREQRAGGG